MTEYQLIIKNMKQTTLGELAIKLKINKSKLAYYFSLGLFKPVIKFGKVNIFDEEKTLKILKEIEIQKKKGVKLEKIKIKK